MKSIMQDQSEQVCYICGGTDRLNNHHIFLGNPNRANSEQYGLKVYLCYTHHLHSKTGVHFNKQLMDRLHREGQEAFEREHGSREDFKRIFGSNYL